MLAIALLFIVLGSRMMTPMSLRIDKLMLLLARRVVDLMLLLSWRISIVFLLLLNLMFLVSLWRNLSSLMLHGSLIYAFVNFFAKRFLLLTSLSASIGYGTT